MRRFLAIAGLASLSCTGKEEPVSPPGVPDPDPAIVEEVHASLKLTDAQAEPWLVEIWYHADGDETLESFQITQIDGRPVVRVSGQRAGQGFSRVLNDGPETAEYPAFQDPNRTPNATRKNIAARIEAIGDDHCLLVEYREKSIVECVLREPRSNDVVREVALSPDGQVVYFSGSGKYAGIWCYHLSDRSLTRLTSAADARQPLPIGDGVAWRESSFVKIARPLSQQQANQVKASSLPPGFSADWVGVDRSGSEPVVQASCGEPWRYARITKGTWKTHTDQGDQTGDFVGILSQKGEYTVVIREADQWVAAARVTPTGDSANIDFRAQGLPAFRGEFVPASAGWKVVDDCEG